MSADLPEMAGHPAGDKLARQRFMGRTIWVTVPGTVALGGVCDATAAPRAGGDERAAVTRRALAPGRHDSLCGGLHRDLVRAFF